MRVTNILLATGAVAASLGNAFLIPPEISTESMKEIMSDLEKITGKFEVDGQLATLVQLGCDGCYGKDGKEKGNLILDLEIPQPKKSSLVINGVSLIPLGANPVISAPMIKPDHDVLNYVITGKDDSVISVALGYDLMIKENMFADHEQIEVTLKVSSVGGRKVRPEDVDYLYMVLTRDDTSGELHIMSLDIKREQPRAASEADFGCTSLFCKWASEIESKVDAFREKAESKIEDWRVKHAGKKGCHQKDKAALAGDFDFSTHAPHRRPHRPQHIGRPHHHHYVQQDGDNSELTLTKIFNQVLFPIFVGVVAGMAVSLICMIVGHFAVKAYQKIKGISFKCPHAERRRRRQQMEREDARSDEESHKALLASEDREEYQDAPPQYVPVVVVVEEAEDLDGKQ